MIEAACHCGELIVRVPRKPRVLTRCNCSMCRRFDPLFAYFALRTVEVVSNKAPPEEYSWGRRVLTWYRCKRCGCFTHHAPAHQRDAHSRVGVNCRMVNPELLEGIPVNLRNGASGTWKLLESYRFGRGEGAWQVGRRT